MSIVGPDKVYGGRLFPEKVQEGLNQGSPTKYSFRIALSLLGDSTFGTPIEIADRKSLTKRFFTEYIEQRELIAKDLIEKGISEDTHLAQMLRTIDVHQIFSTKTSRPVMAST